MKHKTKNKLLLVVSVVLLLILTALIYHLDMDAKAKGIIIGASIAYLLPAISREYERRESKRYWRMFLNFISFSPTKEMRDRNYLVREWGYSTVREFKTDCLVNGGDYLDKMFQLAAGDEFERSDILQQ